MLSQLPHLSYFQCVQGTTNKSRSNFNTKMTMPTTTTTTSRFNCRSPFRRFIVERCTGAVAVAVLTQLSSAQRSQPVPQRNREGTVDSDSDWDWVWTGLLSVQV